MLQSPLKKFSHSRSSSKNSNGLAHSRELSSDIRKPLQGQHAATSNVHNQQPQQQQSQSRQQKSVRMTSMDLAKQYEADRARIIKFCFSKREPDGQFHENYITHVRIIEDSHYPSLRPLADSNPSHKKHRILMLGVKKTGRVRMHKGRENKDGSIQIGRTWDLDELTKLEKDPLVATGFILYLGKPYYWETSTAKEATVFNTSVINTYMKYTNKLPELVHWDLNAMGISIPANVSRNASRSGVITGETKTSMHAPQRAPSENRIPPQRLPSSTPSENSNPKLVVPKSRPDISDLPVPAMTQDSIRFPASSQRPIDESTPPLQIVPPKQSKFVPPKNAVLSSSATNLPESRILGFQQKDQISQPLAQLKQQSSNESVSQVALRPFASKNGTNSYDDSSLTPVSTSTAPAIDSFAGASAVSANHLLATDYAEVRDDVSVEELSNPSLHKIQSINSVSFHKNGARYLDVEKETDDSLNGNLRQEEDEDEDEDDDDGYDVTNYYGDLTSEAENLSRENDATVSIDPRVAKYVNQPNFSSSETTKSSRFMEELFSNINWSISDDVATLEKKLMRQLVVAENESCQLLINIGDDKAELKSSLDSSLSHCKKLDQLMAFFNVELLSFKDEVDQINVKADSVGLVNRTLLYREIASMR